MVGHRIQWFGFRHTHASWRCSCDTCFPSDTLSFTHTYMYNPFSLSPPLPRYISLPPPPPLSLPLSLHLPSLSFSFLSRFHPPFLMPPSLRHNQTLCMDVTFEDNDTTYEVCEWAHDGSGLVYQVVAGPVFNNLYPLAGIFTGFLADYGRRTVWLVISLTFWSIVTGLTGFIKQFWQLVILRALLAIG